MNVLMIGAGNMGLTYAEGMAKSPLLHKKKIMIHDVSAKLIARLGERHEFDIYEHLEDCLPKADVIFLGVKPHHADALMQNMKSMVNSQQIVVSLMAGVTIAHIAIGLGINKVVRTMPNLPAKVGKGVTSYTESSDVSSIELLMIRNLLDTTGVSIRVKNEEFINKSTGISGSGPAYVFYFMQSMLEAAQKMGFTEDDSKILVSTTFEGAIELFNQNDLTPSSWMDKVASKGGTTRAALDYMDDNNVEELIKEAAFAAFNRAVELGER